MSGAAQHEADAPAGSAPAMASPDLDEARHAASSTLGLRQSLLVVFLSGIVVSLALGLYDATVRVPQTPRLAVVDIAKLFAEAEAQSKREVLAATGNGATDPVRRLVEESAGGAGQFGHRVESVLRDLSNECQCVIVVMAAVIGHHNGVWDYTEAAAERLGLRRGDQR